MKPCAQITGWGKCVPQKIVSNEDLARRIDTSDEWIRSRTGIAARRIAEPRDTTASLAIRAARQALAVAGLAPNKVDLIIVATATPEHLFPATACLVQNALGATHAGAFDLSAGCSGFVYALSLAAQAIESGRQRYVLVIGSETLSRVVDWQDRNTCVLFGDGAGAVLLQACQGDGGVLSTVLGSDGSGADLLIIPAGGSKRPTSAATVQNNEHCIHMDGREVYRFATRILAKATREATAAAGIAINDVALLIPHQANQRILEAAAKELGLPRERVYSNLQRYGNTSAASIPIALCEAIEEGRLHPGDHVVLAGFGAGLTWGATVLRWGPPVITPPVQRWRRALNTLGYGWAAVRSVLARIWRRLDALISGPRNGAR
ncbi:MAG: beta-ketoacyl-ACP synthase III [Anaerolineae bacterium]